MKSLAKLSARAPKSALAALVIVAVALSLIGLGAAKTSSPSVNVVPGTESARAQTLATAQFGPSQLAPILLEGPTASLDRQGPALVQALAARPHTRVLSPWDAGSASAGLRPKPTAAMILVSVDRTEKDAVQHDQQQIDSLVARKISAPVRSFITGQPAIDRAERDAALAGLQREALIAIGIAFVLLLLGLRAPVAAAIVTAVVALSTFAGLGAVALLGNVLTLDPVGIAAGTALGLALGFGFALLSLQRFRAAAGAATRTPGIDRRAVLIGTLALAPALALAGIVGPAELMVSVGTGVMACALFALAGSLIVLPAVLALLGARAFARRIPVPARLERLRARLARHGTGATRRAAYAGLAAIVLLGALVPPAVALRSGPPSVSQLPPGSKARTAFEEISRVMGAGWPTPYTITVVAKHGPITTPAVLAAIYQFEQRIARNKGVSSLTGPGQVYATARQLQSFGPQLAHSAAVSDKSKRDLLRLIDGLGQAGAGSAQLQAGLAAASSGAGQLHSGSSAAGAGAGQLRDGLSQAQSGSGKLQAGLGSALSGAMALENGSAKALSGAGQLEAGLGQAQAAAAPSAPALDSLAAQTATTSSQVGSALAALESMTTGKKDPRYAAALNALKAASSDAQSANGVAATVAAQVPALIAGLNQLHAGAAQLRAGIDQLHGGNAQLASGIDQLSGGSGQLTSGLTRLTAGAGALQSGLGRLTNGAGQLASGLSAGVGPAGQLTSGLATMKASVTQARGQIPSTAQLKQLRAQSPGIFSSGYFVLAAVDGATPDMRNAATFTMNLDRGGTAGQITVIPKYKVDDPRTIELGRQLAGLSTSFARTSGLQVAVGGPAASLTDLTSATESRIWLDVAAIALVTAVLLALALQAPLLAGVATLLSLAVAGLTLGFMQLLFGGPKPALGGPGYLDPMTIVSVFTLTFGLTAAFSALVLTRAREPFVAGSGSGDAIRSGLRDTAAVTAAGLLIAATALPFSQSGLLNIEELAIAVAAATLLNVLVVRPLLLPAAASLLGRRGWWPAPSGRAGAPAGLRMPEAVNLLRRLPLRRAAHR